MSTLLGGRFELLGAPVDGPIFSAYQARDTTVGRDASVRLFKSPFSGEPSFVKAIDSAVRRTAAVVHPGVEHLDGVLGDGTRSYLVGEFSAGVSLGERMRRLAPFSVPVSVGTAISILEGLEALHSAGIVHGDISAENIVIAADGSARLQLAGIWEAYSQSATAGVVVLPSMAPYLAPEVSAGSQPSRRSDVYSVGVLLFELLCGRLPYSGDTVVALAMRHATSPVPSVKMYSPASPVVLDEIVKKSMNRDLAVRYQDAGEMLADLRVLRDALRFGRTLTWPLKAQTSSVAAEGSTPPVAPRMSAARPPRNEAPRPRRQRSEEDVDRYPRYLGWAVVVCAAVLAGMFVMWAVGNVSKPKQVAVPSVTGFDVSKARSVLQAAHLDLRENLHLPDERFPADTVLSSDPPAGDKVSEGTTVMVNLSSGSKMVEVPDLSGMELDTARQILANVDLNVQEPVERVDSDKTADEVVGQDPAAKKLAARETSVRLKVSNGNPPTSQANSGANSAETGSTEPPQDSTETHEYSLHIRLSDATTAVNVRIDMDDADGTKTVYEETHDVNDSFTVHAEGRGPEATFRIYYDDDLKKTIHEVAPKPRRRRRRPTPSKPPPKPTNQDQTGQAPPSTNP